MSSWLRSGGDWKTFRAWVAFLAWKDVATTWHTICHPWGGLRWAKNEDIQLGWHTARGQKMWIAEACLQTCGMGLEYGLICGASREHCGKLGQLSCLMSTTVVGHLVWHLAWGNYNVPDCWAWNEYQGSVLDMWHKPSKSLKRLGMHKCNRAIGDMIQGENLSNTNKWHHYRSWEQLLAI